MCTNSQSVTVSLFVLITFWNGPSDLVCPAENSLHTYYVPTQIYLVCSTSSILFSLFFSQVASWRLFRVQIHQILQVKFVVDWMIHCIFVCTNHQNQTKQCKVTNVFFALFLQTLILVLDIISDHLSGFFGRLHFCARLNFMIDSHSAPAPPILSHRGFCQSQKTASIIVPYCSFVSGHWASRDY